MVVAIETSRLLIRNFMPTDWGAFQNVILHYQASVSAQYEPPWPTSAAEIQGIVAWFAVGDDYLCVALKTAGAVIGLLAIEPRNDAEAGPLFYMRTSSRRCACTGGMGTCLCCSSV